MLGPTLWLSLLGGFTLALVVPEHPNPWLITLLLCSTSLGIVLPVLKEADLLQTDEGQTLLLYSLWTDLGVLILAALLLSLHTSNPWKNVGWTVLTVILAVALYGLLMGLRRLPTIRVRVGDLEHRTRGIIATVAAFGALADWVGGQPILASFLVGIVISLVPFAFKPLLKQAFYAIGYSFLIPIYFISVGMDLNPEQFAHLSTWLQIPLWILIAFAVKLAAVWPLRRTYGLFPTLAAGILSSARLSLVVVLADAGAKAGMLRPQTADTLVVFSVLTSLFAPPLFMWIRRKPQT
jgi:Kef-type K+ transport system membrane component KefB